MISWWEMLVAVIFLSVFFLLLLLCHSDGSVRSGECRCDYFGGACDLCMEELSELAAKQRAEQARTPDGRAAARCACDYSGGACAHCMP